MKVNPETCCTHYIRYLCCYFFSKHEAIIFFSLLCIPRCTIQTKSNLECWMW